jgi:hypothetical protein
MVIAGIIAICIVLAVLAFLLPRLSSGPERGVDKSASAGRKSRGKMPF